MRYSLLLIVTAIMMSGSAEANLWGLSSTENIVLEKEYVKVEIKGERAAVMGTFVFKTQRNRGRAKGYSLCLPVYAAPDTDPASIKVVIGVPMDAGEGRDLHGPDHKPPLRKLPLTNYRKKPFGELPTVNGQRPFWFEAKVAKHDLQGPCMVVKVYYEQQLADGVFIYTPIIPDQIPDHDYGTISVSADRPIEMVGKNGHRITKVKDALIFQPSHKQAIIVRSVVDNGDGKRTDDGHVEKTTENNRPTPLLVEVK